MLTSNSNFQNTVEKEKSSRASYLLIVTSNAEDLQEPGIPEEELTL